MKKKISILTIIGLIVGILLGLYFKDITNTIEFIGIWYVKILKFFIAPTLFTGIAYTIYETSKKKTNIVLKTILLFVLMYSVSFIITGLLVTLINPSSGFVFEAVNWAGETTTFNLSNILINLLPKSLNDIFVSPKVFFIIVVAYIFGKVCSYIKGSEKLFEGIKKLRDIIYKLLEYFMYTTPLATMSLIASTISKYGYILFSVGLKYILVAYLCGIVVLLLVMIVPACLINKMNILDYLKKTYKIIIMTITTCSSAATLPYTVKTCKEEFNISDEITDVVVPLGCTIHMCGGAVSFALLGIFCAKLYGINISFSMYLIMLLSSLLINMAAPGIPNGGIVIGATYLELLGIPLGFIGFYSGIYKFLDMCYTTLNVLGDVSANIIINKHNSRQ